MSMNENCLCVLVVTKTAKVSGVGLGLDHAGLGLGLGLGLPGLGLGLSGLGLGLPGLDNISGMNTGIESLFLISCFEPVCQPRCSSPCAANLRRPVLACGIFVLASLPKCSY